MDKLLRFSRFLPFKAIVIGLVVTALFSFKVSVARAQVTVTIDTTVTPTTVTTVPRCQDTQDLPPREDGDVCGSTVTFYYKSNTVTSTKMIVVSRKKDVIQVAANQYGSFYSGSGPLSVTFKDPGPPGYADRFGIVVIDASTNNVVFGRDPKIMVGGASGTYATTLQQIYDFVAQKNLNSREKMDEKKAINQMIQQLEQLKSKLRSE